MIKCDANFVYERANFISVMLNQICQCDRMLNKEFEFWMFDILLQRFLI